MGVRVKFPCNLRMIMDWVKNQTSLPKRELRELMLQNSYLLFNLLKVSMREARVRDNQLIKVSNSFLKELFLNKLLSRLNNLEPNTKILKRSIGLLKKYNKQSIPKFTLLFVVKHQKNGA